MATDWYARWAKLYAEVFGLRDEGDLRALLAWEDALSASEGDLYASSDWLAANPAAFGTTDARFAGRLAMHLGALRVALREQRAIAYRRELSEIDRHGTCTRCGNTGRVVVAHVSGVRGGEWVPLKVARGGAHYYTMAVWCPCRLGRWLEGNHDQKHGAMLHLEQYERANPQWEEQVERRRREQAALAALSPPSPEWAALMNRLVEQCENGG